MDIEQLHLLEAFAGLIALALERTELEAEADQIRLDIETERLRSSLLSAVSHDLRTPLSVITGASSTLLENDQSLDPEVRRELAASILDESERLNRLVANLLDMTRLQAGALEMRKQWQPVEEVIGAALARLSRQLKDHPVTTHIAADLPFAPLDDLLVQQVLVNLLENAARHTPAGTPIEISARHEGDSVVIEVADRGPGLPPGDPNRLFEKFYRRQATVQAQRPHGSRAWAWPFAGASCNFTAARYKRRIARAAARSFGSRCRWKASLRPLPIQEPNADGDRPSCARGGTMTTEGPKILLIEDEQEIRRFLRVSLVGHGYRLVESATGRDGVMQAASQQPDLMILDLGLPDIDGMEVIRQVREWSHMPIIILSARGQEHQKVEALDAGADDYLTKPFSVGELVARIRVALRHVAQDAGESGEPVFVLDGLRVDLVRRQVFVGDEEIHLTPIEYRLLTTLIKHAGKVITHKQLLKEVWGPDSVYETHYLRVYMAQLRRKIEADPARPRFLLTEPGVGYRLASQ